MLQDEGYWNHTAGREEQVYGSTSTMEEQLNGLAKTFKTLSEEIDRLHEMFDVSLSLCCPAIFIYS